MKRAEKNKSFDSKTVEEMIWLISSLKVREERLKKVVSDHYGAVVAEKIANGEVR